MQSTYKIEKPADFRSLITDLFAWYKKREKDGLIIALQGDLGAGKTAFAQELGVYLGVTEPITSPTFTIMKRYELSHDFFDTFIHIDAYRFQDEAEIIPLRLEEFFQQPQTIVCIEWPELIPSIIPNKAIKVQIIIGEDEVRIATVQLPNG